jgi:hypothetical protein
MTGTNVKVHPLADMLLDTVKDFAAKLIAGKKTHEEKRANKEKIRTDTLVSLRSDPALKEQAETYEQNLTSMFDSVPKNLLPLMVNIVSAFFEKVRESSDEYVNEHVTEEQKVILGELQVIEDNWDEWLKGFDAAVTMCQINKIEIPAGEEVPRSYSNRGRPKGSVNTPKA